MNPSLRKAALKSMAVALFKYERIETTLAKAKALRVFAEPLITVAKNGAKSVSARRHVFKKLCDRASVQKLFDELAPLYKSIQGGYTRIMLLGTRRGDCAQMAILELVKRTIPEDKLLRLPKKKEEPQKKEEPKKKEKAKKAGKFEKEEKPSKEEAAAEKAKKVELEAGSAPDVNIKEKEEHLIEDVKKEKARTEQRKVSTQGFFRRFRRKSIG
jgi:large subunit ribosomal protein L17